ncbi:hypothetical protein L5515_001568 [Caenorhabditis briggsae]|nr:hypothetical protein L5515_001568 [Caenorhabditis briggsae]
MARNIALLKDKIEQTRERAYQIRLSLNSGERGLCKRSYISPVTPSPVNTFHITYRPLQRVSDAVVLVSKTKGRRTQASEYVAVEIRDQRVVVHWDIGADKKMITNSHPMNYIPSNDRVTWYHIDILRIGNAVNLTVALKESYDGGFKPRGAPVSVFVGNSKDSSSIFNTIPGETTIDVGTDEATSSEIGLITHKFNGIVGGLRIDGTPLPLWSFESTTGECEGATAPPKTSQRGYLFRDGFAEVSMSVSERTMSAITVVFNAFSPNGLLYFRGSEKSSDFVAIYLNDGRVVFKINLGGGSSAELASQNIYNDGKEHTVKAIRTGSEMYLQVDSDADRFNTVITGENTALNIDNEQHYVAGVPMTLNKEVFSDYSINWNGFIGCILTVKPSQVGELDLDHPEQSQGKSEGCSFSNRSTDKIIGFPKPGYLIAKGISIDNSSTFSFSFRTREENGTLIYQSSKLQKVSKRDVESDGKGYMAFYLFRGYLVLHFGKDASSRKEVVTFRSTHPYNDGQVHAVFMSRNGKTISVYVDDKEIGESQTLSDESSVGTSSGLLVLGGFSDDLKPPNDEIPISSFFIGCISDVLLNLQPVSLTPEKHNAQVGMCSKDENHKMSPMDDPIDGDGHNGHRKSSKLSFEAMNRNYYEVSTQSSHLVMNRDGEEEQNQGEKTCETSIGSLRGAVRYGLSKSSHSRINFEAPYPNITDFTIKLSLQTESSNGMIWVWANYKNYTRYIFLDLIDGFATLEIKGHKQPKILKHLGRRLNDGQWHDVMIEKKNRSLKLRIDSLEAVEMNDCPTPKVMKKRVYVGGVISRHRRQFGLTTPGFDGCIRDFEMNNKIYEHLDDPSTSKNVMPCAKACKLKRSSILKKKRGAPNRKSNQN